ncbi:MAG: DUF4249 domain-containing protein [Bacteroidota bacterium]
MRVRLISFLLLCLVFMHACEQETQITLPVSKPELVVNGILFSGKPIELRLSQTLSQHNTLSIPVENAAVELFENDLSLGLLDQDTAGIYRYPDYNIKEGVLYKVEIFTEQFGTASAQTSIPNKPTLDSMRVHRYTGKDKTGMPLSTLNLFFSDTLGKPNYYQYDCIVCVDSFNIIGKQCYNNMFSYNAAFIHGHGEESKVFTNELFDQNPVHLSLQYQDPSSYYFADDSINQTVYARLITLSEEMYQYTISLNKYINNSESLWLSNNPPLIYNNINNGLGIFAGIAVGNRIQQNIHDFADE